MRTWTWRLLLGACLGLSLGTSCGGQSGTENIPAEAFVCVDGASALVLDASEPADGFETSADDLFAGALGPFAGALLDEQGQQRALTLALTAQGPIVAIERVVVAPRSNLAAEANAGLGAPQVSEDGACLPRYETGLSLYLQTEDGALYETLSGALSASEDGAINFVASLPLEAVQGSLFPVAIDPTEFDEVILVATALLSGSQWLGSLSWRAALQDGEATVEEPVGSFVVAPIP